MTPDPDAQARTRPSAASAAQDPAPAGAEPASSVRRWVVFGLVVVVAAVLCLVASRWQWHRYETRTHEANELAAAWEHAPVPLAELLPADGTELPSSDVWRAATMTGEYRDDATVLLRNRPVSGGAQGDAAGTVFHVLTPFVVTAPGTAADGAVVVVDRGTIPIATDAQSPRTAPAAPTGTQTLDVRVRQDEPPSAKEAPAGQVQAVNAGQVLAAGADGAAWAEGRTTPVYAALVSPATPGVTLLHDAVTEPELSDNSSVSPGVNLSYSFQWIVFAIIAVGGFVMMLRKERGPRLTAGDLLAGHTDAASAREARTRRRAPERRAASDADLEDAEIDAQLGTPAALPAGDEPRQASETSSR